MVRDGEVVELCTGEFAGAQAEPARCAANDIGRLPTGITAGNATPEATLPGFPCCRDGHGRHGRAELVSLGFFGVVGEVGDDAYEVVGGGGFGGGDGAFDCVPVGVAGGAVSGCPGGGQGGGDVLVGVFVVVGDGVVRVGGSGVGGGCGGAVSPVPGVGGGGELDVDGGAGLLGVFRTLLVWCFRLPWLGPGILAQPH